MPDGIYKGKAFYYWTVESLGHYRVQNSKCRQIDRICVFVQQHSVTYRGSVSSFFVVVCRPPNRQFLLQKVLHCAFVHKYKTRKNNNSISTKDKQIGKALCDWPSFWGCRWINKTWLGRDVLPQN